ncbi:SRPBCC family protein [Actinokineospora bangkokensis]|uniref:SRPBCC family protein n=1 Tax=Actinokineospora bangkokensis TaxID=1193682 RepID=UPI0013013E35|nr:SRPBCC family protein [Actinokineospora bangkokensis]
MPTHSATRFVPAPVGAVWPVVSEASRLPDWCSFADRVDVVSGSGVGQLRLARALLDGGRRQEVDQEVVEFEPGARVAWRQLAERVEDAPAPVRATGVVFRVVLAPEGDGTRVRFETSRTPVGLGNLLALHLFGGPRLTRTLDESLVRLTRSLA